MPETAWLGMIYLQFRRELFLTAWTVLRRVDLAEDAVHAAFIRLVQREAPPSDAKLYVFRSVRNAAIDLARTRSRRREETLPAQWDAPQPDAGHPDTELLQLVEDLLEKVDADSREVIELHLHAGLTFQEIGQMLDEPLPTVASRYRRALDRISKEMKVRHE